MSTQLSLSKDAMLIELIETSATGLAIVDGRGCIQYANQSFARFCGQPAKALEGTSLFDWMQKWQFPVNLMQQVRAQKTVHEQTVLLARNGHSGLARFSFAPLPEQGARAQAFRVELASIAPTVISGEEKKAGSKRYEELLNSVEAVVWEAEPNSLQFTYISRQVEKILGYPAHLWTSQPDFWKDHIHPEDRNWVVEFCQRESQANRIHQIEYRMIAADGRIVWLRDIVTPHAENGRLVHLRGIFLDISQNKWEQQVREVLYSIGETVISSSTLNEMLSRIHQNIRKLMYAENCYIALYDEITDRFSFPYFVDENDPPPAPRSRRKGLTEYVWRKRRPLLLTPQKYRSLLKKGEIEVIGTPPKSWLGVPLIYGKQTLGVLAVQSYNDRHVYGKKEKEVLAAIGNQTALVLGRKLAEERMAILAHAVESISECVSVTDMQNRILFVNRAFLQTYGYSEQELIGQPIEMVRSPKNDPDVVAQILPATLKGGWQGEIYNRRKDGSDFPISLSTAVIRDEQGQNLALIGVCKDITRKKKLEEERKKLTEQFYQSQKMDSIGRLAGGIAHDFNNLLTVIKGYASLLLSRQTPSSPQYPVLSNMLAATEKAERLTSQLLTFSRKQISQQKPLNLNDVIQDTARMLDRLIGEHIQVVLHLTEPLPTVMADRGYLEQVLINLAVNARDAMPDGGTLSISTKKVYLDEQYCRMHSQVSPGHYVLLAVSDTGVGMDEETQRRVFEPFFTTKPRGKGTGLGLSTVFGIVKQHRGFIWLYSEPQKGTEFKIYLPVCGMAAQKSSPSKQEESSFAGQERVLIVEDEKMVRELAQTVLLEYGYQVVAAREGKEALELAESVREPFQLLITDVIMPEMSGKEVARQLQARWPELKVLYMSGYTDDFIVQQGVLEEGLHYLQKPFSPLELARAVRRALQDEE